MSYLDRGESTSRGIRSVCITRAGQRQLNAVPVYNWKVSGGTALKLVIVDFHGSLPFFVETAIEEPVCPRLRKVNDGKQEMNYRIESGLWPSLKDTRSVHGSQLESSVFCSFGHVGMSVTRTILLFKI